MVSYWPWWLGAFGLAGTAIVYLLVVRRALGFSGAVNTMLSSTARASERGATAIDGGTTSRGAAAGGDPAEAASALSWSRSVLFVAGSIIGGAVFAVVAKAPLETAPTGLYEHLYGKAAWLALFVGGGLVGFGTSLAGGCTSGHGLVGCSRLQAPSLVATACFFGIAIAIGLVVKSLGWAP